MDGKLRRKLLSAEIEAPFRNGDHKNRQASPRAPFHTSLAFEENTKRIRREYEENTKAPPEQPASIWLVYDLMVSIPSEARRLQVAFPGLCPNRPRRSPDEGDGG